MSQKTNDTEKLVAECANFDDFDKQTAVSAHLKLLTTFEPRLQCPLCDEMIQADEVTEHIIRRLTVMAFIMDDISLDVARKNPDLMKKYRKVAMNKYLQIIKYKSSIKLPDIGITNKITNEGRRELEKLNEADVAFMCLSCASKFVFTYAEKDGR